MAEASAKEYSLEDLDQNITEKSLKDVINDRRTRTNQVVESQNSMEVSENGDSAADVHIESGDTSNPKTHVVKDDNKSVSTKTQNSSSKSSKYSPAQSPVDRRLDPTVSSEGVGKRRRVQHDYRRLSSSGYVDGYLSRERRFSSANENDLGVSPASPKIKQGKIRSLSAPVANGTQIGEHGY